MILSDNNIRLVPDPSARSKAVAISRFQKGSIIVSVPSLSTVLVTSEKGNRCDTCFRIKIKQRSLQKCTGCGSYWYCDVECQNIQWKAHHKRICKLYNRFTSSNSFQILPAHVKLDSLLLTHLLAQISSSKLLSGEDESSPLAIFRSLLCGPAPHAPIPPVCGSIQSISADLIGSLYSRFGNNNFAIHSHLNTIGHGIFPLASRLFNHSCAPNAAARYALSAAGPVTMEVIALRDISPEEEISIPYLDPALLQSRQQIFDFTYGFKCSCASCQLLQSLGPIPSPPVSPEGLALTGRLLREFVGIDYRLGGSLPSGPRGDIPRSLLHVFHETYVSNLSEAFSKAAHEGQYVLALDAGITLLALYTIIYPPNYPQIGMHLLELAKTAWNMFISSSIMNVDQERLEGAKGQARIFLSLSRQVLSVFGPEGDEEGPLQEAETLQQLLN